MTKETDHQAIGKLISCLSLLEEKTHVLYRTLAENIDLPIVRSLMLMIARDSQKHSTALKNIGEAISPKGVKVEDCEKNIGVSWHSIEALQSEISRKGKLTEGDLAGLSERLVVLESVVGEEYYVFVQLKTLQLMAKEINQNYDVDVESLKSIFTGIINDEEHHRGLIEKIKGILENRVKPKTLSAPDVRYQNPDAWIRPTGQ